MISCVLDEPQSCHTVKDSPEFLIPPSPGSLEEQQTLLAHWAISPAMLCPFASPCFSIKQTLNLTQHFFRTHLV